MKVELHKRDIRIQQRQKENTELLEKVRRMTAELQETNAEANEKGCVEIECKAGQFHKELKIKSKESHLKAVELKQKDKNLSETSTSLGTQSDQNLHEEKDLQLVNQTLHQSVSEYQKQLCEAKENLLNMEAELKRKTDELQEKEKDLRELHVLLKDKNDLIEQMDNDIQRKSLEISKSNENMKVNCITSVN